MRNNVHFLYPFKGIELTTPPGAAPYDRFQPLRIRDNFLLKIGIRAEDILFAQLNAEPGDGRFSYVEGPRDFFLGYVFEKHGGVFKVERLCHAPCCPPQHFPASDSVIVAPITHIYRHKNGITSRFVFHERRGELWET